MKLSQTKSYDQKTTVLHVIAKYATKKNVDNNQDQEDMLDMLKQIPLLEQATKLPMKTLEAENKNLRRSLQQVLKQLKNAPIMDPGNLKLPCEPEPTF